MQAKIRRIHLKWIDAALLFTYCLFSPSVAVVEGVQRLGAKEAEEDEEEEADGEVSSSTSSEVRWGGAIITSAYLNCTTYC